jgi:hypothetical protein
MTEKTISNAEQTLGALSLVDFLNGSIGENRSESFSLDRS